MPTDPSAIEAVAMLDESVRRALYDWVVAADHAVGREEAATGVGVSRALAAFHLDRLVDAGLLVAEYRRLSGRAGPGAGRPAKLYRRGPLEVSLSLPQRSYEVPARLFATAMAQLTGSGAAPDAVREEAHALGEAVGSEARSRAGARPGRKRLRGALLETLEGRGYEPHEVPPDEIRLGNCPYHALVEDHRDLVCGMNLALAEGILDGLGDDRSRARLDPQPGQCCVAITTSSGDATPG